MLPVEVFLASVTCLFRSPPPGENRWNGDTFSQGKVAAVAHPLTATRSERQWLGTRPPADLRGAYFYSHLGSSAPSLTPHNGLGLLSLPCTPESPESLQSLQLDLPCFMDVKPCQLEGQGWPALQKEVFHPKISRHWISNPGSPFTGYGTLTPQCLICKMDTNLCPLFS